MNVYIYIYIYIYIYNSKSLIKLTNSSSLMSFLNDETILLMFIMYNRISAFNWGCL